MGHRHMTYLYIYDEKGNEAIGTLYNQWNFESIQAHKIIRFEKQLAKWLKNKIRFPLDYSRWVEMYNHIASVSDTTMDTYFQDRMIHYNDCSGMYEEDNNNGWQFVVIKVDDDYKPVKITYGFKLNKYIFTGDKCKLVKGFVNLYKNIMYGDKGTREEYQIKKIENYLKDFSQTDQNIMEKVNNSFDLKIIKFAEGKIKNYIDKKRNKID